MSNEVLYQSALSSERDKLATREIKHGRVRALLGDVVGNLVGPSGAPWVLARLFGDPSRRVEAYNGTPLTPAIDVAVVLLVRYENGRATRYDVEGLDNGVTYPGGYNPGASGGVASHHLSHEGVAGGGWDLVNVYPLNMTMLRADPQTIPDLTVQVAAGYYIIDGTLYYFAGGNSGSFTPPGSGARFDVLTVDTAGTLAIQTGALTTPPLAFTLPAGVLPLLAVLLTAGQTAIQRPDMYDVRGFLSITSSSAAPSGPFALTGVLTPPAMSADQNNYNPAGLASAATLRLSATTPVSITGLDGGSTGRILFIHNIDVNAITLVSESGLSTAARRFALASATITLNYNTLVIAQYDATDQRWRVNCCGGGATTPADMTDSDGTLLVDSDGTQITES